MVEKIIRDGLLFWATIDPVGTLVLFVALTGALGSRERKRLALRATLYAGIILIGAVVFGQILLAAMGVRLISLQVAGGIVLLLFGLHMIFSSSPLGQAREGESGHDLAVFPLALPSIASPGAITAAIVATDNDLYSVGQQAVTSVILLAVLCITYVMLLGAERILQVIGRQGALVLVRVMGMILAALSVELVMEGLGVERWLSHGP